MDESQLQQLSRRERQIMDLIFQHQEMTAQDVTDHLEDAPSYTTVRTLLRILEEKGHLQHRKEGKKYVYRSTTDHESVRQSSLRHLLKTFFGGSISEAVATFISHPDSNLSKKELKELEQIIAQAQSGNEEE